MTKLTSLLILSTITLFGQTPRNNEIKSNASFVNPFIGTGGHGHTYPGATVPFGMVQLSPDTRTEGWDACGGYHDSDTSILGFSHTHLSGTGIQDYGDILIMPTLVEWEAARKLLNKNNYPFALRHSNNLASPGFFQTTLGNNLIKVELTTTKRAGFHSYTFDKTGAKLVLDLVHHDKIIKSDCFEVSDKEIQGYRISESWAKEQHIYFVMRFSQPFGRIAKMEGDKKTRALMEFNLKTSKNKLLVKVGISAVSIENARKNLDEEIPDWDFEKTKQGAEKEWNGYLDKIQIPEGTNAQKEIFYTALYHSLLAPNLYQDTDGTYRGMDLKVHKDILHNQYTVFSLWDTYRAAHPLYTILDTARVIDFIHTFLSNADEGKFLPMWPLAGNETWCMIGDHAIPVIVDAWKKGIRGFDAPKALAAMIQTANRNQSGHNAFAQKNYISVENDHESVSKTLEMAYDAWCIAQFAKDLGQKDIFKEYMQRAQSYKHLFNPKTRFFQAKKNSAFIEPFDPSEINSHFTEGNAWQYAFYAPQDVDFLISSFGGTKELGKKLDSLFSAPTKTTGREQVDVTGLIGQYAHGNEPSHHIAYLYNYAEQPWKTQEKIHQICHDFYQNKPDGLIGNEDCGQMSAWYIFSALGFYPVNPCGGEYVIGTPIFPKSVLELGNGKKFTTLANNVSDTCFYIQSATLNGKRLQTTFLTHQEIMSGGELVFEMGSKPNRLWAIEQLEPQSSITEHRIDPMPFIASGQVSFRDSTKITISGISKKPIYYTRSKDKSPKDTTNSIKYTQPFFATDPTTIYFWQGDSLTNEWNQSAYFSKNENIGTLQLQSKYAKQYASTGYNALYDGITGAADYQSGDWQGFEGTDLEAVIDLEKTQSFNEIGINFLQDQNAWIFFPKLVEFQTSNDGIRYSSIGLLNPDVPNQPEGATIKKYAINKPIQARFVRIVAKSMTPIPSWHKGAKGKAWIFADEITIH
jgi:predicted alpha-1,2-mannosidase